MNLILLMVHIFIGININGKSIRRFRPERVTTRRVRKIVIKQIIFKSFYIHSYILKKGSIINAYNSLKIYTLYKIKKKIFALYDLHSRHINALKRMH